MHDKPKETYHRIICQGWPEIKMKEELDDIIEKAINSVASKKADMAQWEMDSRRMAARKRWRIYGISAAASVVLICAVGISFYFTRQYNAEPGMTSSPTVYRGGSADLSEISALIEATKYDDAMNAIETTMADTAIDMTFSPERQEYMRSLNHNRNYELTWLKIDVLIKTGKIDDAIKLLTAYAEEEGVHQQEAKELLKNLTK